MITGFSFLLALLLSIIHLYGARWKLLQVIPRSKWLSFGSGISVSYVFAHLLPELQSWQEDFVQNNEVDFLSNHLYLVALLGLIIFYGLEEAVTKSKKNKDIRHEEYHGVFWVHILSFTLYNTIIGYLLIAGENLAFSNLLFFFVAMAFHFLVNDYALWVHHQKLYVNKGRWIATAGIFSGWLTGRFYNLPDNLVAILFALVAGGILLNILKEEMPEAKESKFSYFLLGSVLYLGLNLLSGFYS